MSFNILRRSWTLAWYPKLALNIAELDWHILEVCIWHRETWSILPDIDFCDQRTCEQKPCQRPRIWHRPEPRQHQFPVACRQVRYLGLCLICTAHSSEWQLKPLALFGVICKSKQWSQLIENPLRPHCPTLHISVGGHQKEPVELIDVWSSVVICYCQAYDSAATRTECLWAMQRHMMPWQGPIPVL